MKKSDALLKFPGEEGLKEGSAFRYEFRVSRFTQWEFGVFGLQRLSRMVSVTSVLHFFSRSKRRL